MHFHPSPSPFQMQKVEKMFFCSEIERDALNFAATLYSPPWGGGVGINLFHAEKLKSQVSRKITSVAFAGWYAI